ncbi:MAG: hypothetical protein QW728_00105, partial [Thermoplasmata archaeon]
MMSDTYQKMCRGAVPFSYSELNPLLYNKLSKIFFLDKATLFRAICILFFLLIWLLPVLDYGGIIFTYESSLSTPYTSFSTIACNTVGETFNTAYPSANITKLSRESDSSSYPNTFNSSFVWWNTSWHFRIHIEITSTNHTRWQYPVFLRFNMTQILADAGCTEQFDPRSPRLIEQFTDSR